MGTTSKPDKLNQKGLCELTIDSIDPKHKVKIGPNVTMKIKTLLRNYKDVFVWTPLDMTRVSLRVITHKLNINLMVNMYNKKENNS